jgi:hypothetical protein
MKRKEIYGHPDAAVGTIKMDPRVLPVRYRPSSVSARPHRRSSYRSASSSGSSVSTSSKSIDSQNIAPAIALFGAEGKTGHHFLRLALDAGYNVNAYLSPKVSLRSLEEFAHQPSLSVTTGKLEDIEQLQQAISGAQYVVCMLNDTLPGKKEYPAGCLVSFVNRLYPILQRESSVQLLIFQSTSLATSVSGPTPLLSKVVKRAARRRCAFTKDQDAVVRYIAAQHGLRQPKQSNPIIGPEKRSSVGQRSIKADDQSSVTRTDCCDDALPPHFSFIVTRPTILLKDGPPSKTLSASKSQPGLFPVAHVDLAEFTLTALQNEKLYNTSPYVVADIF